MKRFDAVVESYMVQIALHDASYDALCHVFDYMAEGLLQGVILTGTDG